MEKGGRHMSRKSDLPITIGLAEGWQVLEMEMLALEDGIALRPTPEITRATAFYVAYAGDVDPANIVGIGGLVHHKGGARIRCAWVCPEYRRRGVWWKLVEHRVSVARDMGEPFVETWAVHPGPLLRNGWHIASVRHRNGAVHVRKDLT
jgi:GNAT superfamily N-acetyltransferase